MADRSRRFVRVERASRVGPAACIFCAREDRPRRPKGELGRRPHAFGPVEAASLELLAQARRRGHWHRECCRHRLGWQLWSTPWRRRRRRRRRRSGDRCMGRWRGHRRGVPRHLLPPGRRRPPVGDVLRRRPPVGDVLRPPVGDVLRWHGVHAGTHGLVASVLRGRRHRRRRRWAWRRHVQRLRLSHVPPIERVARLWRHRRVRSQHVRLRRRRHGSANRHRLQRAIASWSVPEGLDTDDLRLETGRSRHAVRPCSGAV